MSDPKEQTNTTPSITTDNKIKGNLCNNPFAPRADLKTGLTTTGTTGPATCTGPFYGSNEQSEKNE